MKLGIIVNKCRHLTFSSGIYPVLDGTNRVKSVNELRLFMLQR